MSGSIVSAAFRASRNEMTSGALLSLIAQAHIISLSELVSISQVTPQRLLELLKDLNRTQLVEVEGLGSLEELNDIFEANGEDGETGAQPNDITTKNHVIGEIRKRRPDSKIVISRKGFGRALAM